MSCQQIVDCPGYQPHTPRKSRPQQDRNRPGSISPSLFVPVKDRRPAACPTQTAPHGRTDEGCFARRSRVMSVAASSMSLRSMTFRPAHFKTGKMEHTPVVGTGPWTGCAVGSRSTDRPGRNESISNCREGTRTVHGAEPHADDQRRALQSRIRRCGTTPCRRGTG